MPSPELNPGQQVAVGSTSKRIVVSAGAGSGKTRVLAERFVDAVLRGEADGEQEPMRSVLLITFTDKAAGELVERVRRVFLERGRPDLAREVDRAWISTIHGFCARIVRRHALELGIDPAFKVLADPQVGIVRLEAFERAATERVSERATSLLIELHGPEQLRATVLSAYDRVRSMGSSLSDVVPCEVPDLPGSLLALVPVLREAMTAYEALSPTATIASNIGGYRAATELVGSLAGCSAEGAAFAAAGLNSYRGKLSGGAEMKEITREANAALDVASRAGVDTLAGSHVRAWLGLLDGYACEYENAKDDLGALDFEDLQLMTRRLWVDQPDTADRYARQFAQVMIDEFQDTNGLQFEAVRPVAGRGLCLVGDVQQSIYRFRDADVGLFVDQRRSAEAARDEQACRLTINYRSHPELLATLNTLFAREGFFGADYLHLEGAEERASHIRWGAGEPRTEAIIVDKAGWQTLTWREAEARTLARRLRELVDDGRMVPDDIVVLVRATTTMRTYVEALRRVGFDVYAGDAGGFYAAPEVADVRALLRVLANPLDGEGVLGLLAGGLGGLSDDALFLLAASRPDRDLWAALPGAAEAGLDPDDAERALLIRGTMDGLRGRLWSMRLADAILHAVAVLGPGGGCLGRTGARGNLQKAARLAAEFEKTTPADPAAFLRYLGDRESYVRKEALVSPATEGAGAVRVMTVHGAKGLEFPVVAVADLGHGQVNKSPAFMIVRDDEALRAVGRVAKAGAPDGAPDASAWRSGVDEEQQLDLEESKRVFYVACTRAEQVLLLAGSAQLEKPPGDALPVDWLRCAIEEAGDRGVPGLAVTRVTCADEDGLADEPDTAVRQTAKRSSHEPAPLAVLRAPEPIGSPSETSYTALALYERCPYRFFAERMLGVGSVDVAAGEDPRALGSALHGALQTLAEGRAADTDRLVALAAAHGLATGEIPRLRSAVDAFVASPVGALLEPGRAEVPFTVNVAGGIVVGSMDLVVRDAGAATVVDYKTGLSTEPDEARYAAQAEIYALALLVDGCSEVSVRFVRVESGCQETVFVFTDKDRVRIAARVGDTFSRMARGEFDRLPAFDAVVCPDCPVSGGLCPIVHPGGRPARRT